MQLLFGWFEASINRSGVISLCVWKPETIRKPALGDWEESLVGKERLLGGQQWSVAYSSWLRFFTPLSHSQIGGEL